MAILEERGLFWWSDEPVPEHQFAPDSCLTGLLTIDDDGRTRLELDGYFPSKHGPMTSMMRRGQPIAKESIGHEALPSDIALIGHAVGAELATVAGKPGEKNMLI